jgi:dihydropteroate synthase
MDHIAVTVDPLQVLDEALPEAAHDFRVDLIVTPDEVIQAAHPRPRPGIIWADLEADKIRAIPVLAACERSLLPTHRGRAADDGTFIWTPSHYGI